MKKARLIASYLPQFHPIPENNEWWGEGFTEWTNVGKAEKLFANHYQPRVPADLGYYDLRLKEVHVAQSEMALQYGVESFCYWHYWFGNGKRILEMPFNRHLNDEDIKIGFCLAWANETWSGIWHGAENRILVEQLYPGKQDYINHFNAILPALKDKRYTRIDGKLVFMVYKPDLIPDSAMFFETFNQLAKQHGLEGFYFIAQTVKIEDKERLIAKGFNAINVVRMYDFERLTQSKIKRGIKQRLFNQLRVYQYADALTYMDGIEDELEDCIPSIIPNWDHSPRSGKRAFILHESTPELFKIHAEKVINRVQNKENKVVFIKSWNEWGECNYLEPDIKFGKRYLEELLKVVSG